MGKGNACQYAILEAYSFSFLRFYFEPLSQTNILYKIIIYYITLNNTSVKRIHPNLLSFLYLSWMIKFPLHFLQQPPSHIIMKQDLCLQDFYKLKYIQDVYKKTV